MADVSETIREFIRINLDNKFDFSNVKSRNKLFLQHAESEIGKKQGLDYKKHLTLYLRMIKKVCRERNIPPETFGLSKEKVKFQQSSSGVTTKITPKPKEGIPQTVEQPKTDAAGKPIPPTTPTLQMPVPEVGIELVKATWKTINGVIRYKYPKFRKFMDEDLEALGQAWLPLFREYIATNWMKWGLPLTITAGIMIPRIAELKPKGDEEEEEPEEEEEKPKEKESEEYKKWKQGKAPV